MVVISVPFFCLLFGRRKVGIETQAVIIARIIKGKIYLEDYTPSINRIVEETYIELTLTYICRDPSGMGYTHASRDYSLLVLAMFNVHVHEH